VSRVSFGATTSSKPAPVPIDRGTWETLPCGDLPPSRRRTRRPTFGVPADLSLAQDTDEVLDHLRQAPGDRFFRTDVEHVPPAHAHLVGRRLAQPSDQTTMIEDRPREGQPVLGPPELVIVTRHVLERQRLVSQRPRYVHQTPRPRAEGVTIAARRIGPGTVMPPPPLPQLGGSHEPHRSQQPVDLVVVDPRQGVGRERRPQPVQKALKIVEQPGEPGLLRCHCSLLTGTGYRRSDDAVSLRPSHSRSTRFGELPSPDGWLAGDDLSSATARSE
jgi:hypothetical protein